MMPRCHHLHQNYANYELRVFQLCGSIFSFWKEAIPSHASCLRLDPEVKEETYGVANQLRILYV